MASLHCNGLRIGETGLEPATPVPQIGSDVVAGARPIGYLGPSGPVITYDDPHLQEVTT
jgi:hypothetical protein